MLLSLFLFVVVSSSAGQGGAFNDIALKSGAWVAGGATVRFCTPAATGVPCSPLASVYSDAALTTPLANPTVADASGNISGIYAAPGNYKVQVSGTGLTTRTYTVTIAPDMGSVAWVSNFRGGSINVVTDCGLVADNATDNLAAMNLCLATYKSAHYIFPGCSFNPQGGGAANVPCYFFSGQITASYNGTHLDGAIPSVWNSLVGLRFPTGVGGVRFETNCYGCKISNLGLVGADAWSSSNLATFTDWTPTLLKGSGADGLQLLGGSPLVENVAIYGFGRNGIFLDGSSSISASTQPDAWTVRNVILSSNRAYGIHTIGCDSNVGAMMKVHTAGNMLAGIYDYSCLGNTWIAPDSTLDGRSAISAGATSNISTVSVAGTTMTLTTATAVAGWVASTWVTIAGTVNCNGTFKVLSGTSSNMTLNYPSGACASEAVGTAQKASSASVFSTLTARAAGAGEAPIIECAFGSRTGSSNQVWINPYQESNSAAPCWDTGTLVIGGQIATAPTQNFTWITNNAGGLVVKGGQAATIQNPGDALLAMNLQAGSASRKDVSINFKSFDGVTKHTIKSSSLGSLSFTDTNAIWMQKTEGGALLIRGATATEDVTINQSLGRDTLFYCGTATICGKFLNSDSGFYVLNGIRPFTAGGAPIGSNPLPFSSVFIGNAATNNAQLTGTFTAARVATISDETQTLVGRIAAVDATAQTAAITTTTLYAVPSTGAGQYLLSWDAKVTTAAGVSSTLGALTIVYTDPDGVVQTITAGAQTSAGAIATTNAGNSTTTVLLGVPLLINAKASTNITYAFAYASNAANAMAYNLHLVLDKQ